MSSATCFDSAWALHQFTTPEPRRYQPLSSSISIAQYDSFITSPLLGIVELPIHSGKRSADMGSPMDLSHKSSSPVSTGSLSDLQLSRPSSASGAPFGSPRVQTVTEQSTDSLITTLRDRSDSLTLCLFGGLVEASESISSPKKQELTWIKVEPGQSPKSSNSSTSSKKA